MDYRCTEFGVNSPSHTPFRAQTDKHTKTQLHTSPHASFVVALLQTYLSLSVKALGKSVAFDEVTGKSTGAVNAFLQQLSDTRPLHGKDGQNWPG